MANYLYNGIELPDIYTVYTPEIQKEYPFLYLTYAHIGSWYSYYLNISKLEKSLNISLYLLLKLFLV